MSFLGIGPGRCGTLSLSKILGSCRNVLSVHEDYSLAGSIIEMTAVMNRTQGSWNVGFIGASWTPQVVAVRDRLPRCPVICLHRDKQEVIDSFGVTLIINSDGMQPTGEELLTPEAIADRWEMCELSMAAVPAPVMHLRTEDLNSDGKLYELFEFVGIPEDDRNYPENRRWNKRHLQVAAMAKHASSPSP